MVLGIQHVLVSLRKRTVAEGWKRYAASAGAEGFGGQKRGWASIALELSYSTTTTLHTKTHKKTHAGYDRWKPQLNYHEKPQQNPPWLRPLVTLTLPRCQHNNQELGTQLLGAAQLGRRIYIYIYIYISLCVCMYVRM